MQKKQLILLFGGRSAEHDVSIISAQNVFKAIDKDKYNIHLIGIHKNGDWIKYNEDEFLKEKFNLNSINDDNFVNMYSKNGVGYINVKDDVQAIDIAIPILHGPHGEDGTIQGLLKSYQIPFIGADVLGSAVGMDKDIAKKLLKESNIPIVDSLTFRKYNQDKIIYDKIIKKLNLPIFVKPANLGSSVGISKVNNKEEFDIAIQTAFKYDKKIIIEKFVDGKEIEFAVLGNDDLTVSIAGEIIPTHDFYSYEAKYLDNDGAKMSIPADISSKVMKEMQELAKKTYKTLCCEGMGRVDFLLSSDNEIYVNEINTIPGFTSMSMYPELLNKTGISYKELIDKLISLAIERANK